MTESWTVDARLRLTGATADLCHCNWGSPVEIVRTFSSPLLTLSLSRMSDLRECFFPLRQEPQPAAIGALALWPANVPIHSRSGAGRFRFLQLHIDPDHFAAMTQLGEGWDPAAAMNITGTAIDGLMMQLAHEVAAPGYAAQVIAEGLVLAIIGDLARYLRQIASAEDSGRLSPAQLGRIERYVEEADGTSATIASIADIVGVSRRHLTRMFKHTTGQTIHEYVAHVRVRRAGALLCGTDLPVKEISRRLGFASLASFSAAFRGAVGQTPSAYRRALRPAAAMVA